MAAREDSVDDANHYACAKDWTSMMKDAIRDIRSRKLTCPPLCLVVTHTSAYVTFSPVLSATMATICLFHW